MSRSQTATPSPESIELFHDKRRALLTIQAAQTIWTRRFSTAERDQLGGDFREAIEKYGNVVKMWAIVKNVSLSLATIEAAKSFGILTEEDSDWLRSEGGELPRNDELAREQAIERGHLVVDRSSMLVYWKGERLRVEWVKRLSVWKFFVRLCEHAKKNESVGWDSFGVGSYPKFVTDKKRLLKKMDGMQMDLFKRIVVVGTGRQKLDIPADEIFLIQISH